MSVPVDQAIDVAKELLVKTGDLAQGSLSTYFADWESLLGYVLAQGVGTPVEIDTELLRRWLGAADSSGHLPLVASQHRRRASVRKLFACWRALDIVRPEHNPTSDLPLPPRSGKAVRPLDDHEVNACRWASRDDGASTRYSAIWALAEAGATPTELTQIRRSAVDLDHGIVELPGAPRVRPRKAQLTDWGADRLQDHLTMARWTNDRHLVYGHEKVDIQTRLSTLSGALRRILCKAELAAEPDVKAESVRAWIGRSMRDGGAPIEKVALRLGLSDLNKAMALIGEDWEAEGE